MAPTPEQLRLMEENRKKALEKRAERLAAESNKKLDHNQNSVGTPAVGTKTTSFYSNARVPSLNSPQQSSSSKVAPHSAAKPFANKQPPTIPISARPVVNFQLVSRNRFCVEAPFDNEIIEIFKQFPSKTYDGASRKWTFLLSDHPSLLKSLNPILSRFQLQPLPRYVLDIFRNAPATRSVPEVDISDIDPHLRQALLPFQKESIFFGIQLKGKILIADDMGLGKTLQALALAHYYLADWPLLIVTPSSMKYSWEEAVRVWLPSIPLHHIQVVCSGKDYIDSNLAVTICSYDLLSRKSKELENMRYKTIIFDESHLVKSRSSARAKAAAAVCQKSLHIILLSGTPALSRPEELFSQLQMLEGKYIFGGFHNFGLRYCGGKETNFGWTYTGATNMTELQLLLEEKYMIRRLKSNVLSQLPAKQRQMMVLDPGKVQCNTSSMKSMADQMGQKFNQAMEKRGALLSYYSETAKAKSKAVCEYIGEQLDLGKKFLCFGHHQSLMKDICEFIEKKKIEYIKIDGHVSADERKKLCDLFQLKDSVRVAVLSITAANTGLTLTAANLVIFAELFWNPGVLTQAEDRAHRIGQQDSVIVQYLVAKSTADDYLWPLVQSKLDILSQAGLSKDNFHDASTTNLSNEKGTILEFLEELSKEELESVDLAIQESSSYEPQSKRIKSN